MSPSGPESSLSYADYSSDSSFPSAFPSTLVLLLPLPALVLFPTPVVLPPSAPSYSFIKAFSPTPYLPSDNLLPYLTIYLSL